MEKAIAAIGAKSAQNAVFELGPGAHLTHYPLAGGTLMNLVAYVTDANDWSGDKVRMTAPASKADVVKAFSEWGPAVRQVIDNLPEHLERWGIFDLCDNPLETYAYGAICLAGDAARK